MNIFVLDDEIHKFPRNQIRSALMGHTVTVAMSADEAKSRYKGPYDLLLLDHDMLGYYQPSGDPNTGYQFCAWLVEKFPDHRTKVVLHSQNGQGREKMRKLLQAEGWDKVWEYPFSSQYPEFLASNVRAL